MGATRLLASSTPSSSTSLPTLRRSTRHAQRPLKPLPHPHISSFTAKPVDCTVWTHHPGERYSPHPHFFLFLAAPSPSSPAPPKSYSPQPKHPTAPSTHSAGSTPGSPPHTPASPRPTHPQSSPPTQNTPHTETQPHASSSTSPESIKATNSGHFKIRAPRNSAIRNKCLSPLTI